MGIVKSFGNGEGGVMIVSAAYRIIFYTVVQDVAYVQPSGTGLADGGWFLAA